MRGRQGRTATLSQELTSFVGGQRQVDQARRLLSTSRLLTLTGPGGVGKTRLALRVADKVRRAFRDGTCLVELGALHEPGLLAQTVAVALGVWEKGAERPVDLLRDHLAPRRLLLILDNCEHLVDACALLADRLLRECPHLRILATSREPLNIPSEVTMTVAPLSVPGPEQLRPPSSPSSLGQRSALEQSPAVRLFVERATSVAPDFRLTEQNQATVVELCRRLDGLPLAVELAAARLRQLSPDQILDRLGRPYDLLTRAPRTAPLRHQTLQASMQWSYDLCTDAERRAWARLAIFAGTFELDAATAVVAARDPVIGEPLDVIASLIDKSILGRQPGDVTTYRMLETLREFGLHKLEASGESAAVQRRHRDYYRQLVEHLETDWSGPRQAAWLARIDREHANLQAALGFCLREPGEQQQALAILVALPSYYWWTRGLFSEGRYWLRQALAHVTEATVLRARGLLLDSQLSIGQGRFPPPTWPEARQLAEQLAEPRTLAYAHYVAGLGALWNGDPSGAKVRLDQAFAIASSGIDADLELEVLTVLGAAHGLCGEPDQVETCLDLVRDRTSASGEIFHRQWAEWTAGIAAWDRGDLGEAKRLQRRALLWARALDARNAVAWALESLAWVEAAERRPDRAATLLGAADILWQVLGTGTTAFRSLHDHHLTCERQVREALGPVAFEAAARRGRHLSPQEAVAYAVDDARGAPSAPAVTPSEPSEEGLDSTLTRRERQIAGLITAGLTNKEIADRLVIAPRTAEYHVENILIKLGFTSRTQVAAAWIAARSTAAPGTGPDGG